MKSDKDVKLKKKKILNPWIFVAIFLTLIFAGFIFYDKSPVFHREINSILGIENNIQHTKISLTVLTDKSLTDPLFDLETQVETLKEEINAELNITYIDINDENGKQLIEYFEFITVPVLIFDDAIEETQFYKDASTFFSKKDDYYVVILKPFKYLKYPDVGDAYTKGNESAKITIVEYSSFSCPYCALMRDTVYQALLEYPDKILYAYKHYDRGGIDLKLSNASECAGEQGKFWEMHDYIFDHQQDFKEKEPEDILNSGATEIELDIQGFQECMDENRYKDKIEGHTQEAYSFAISGTPGLFVNDKFIGGAISFESLQSVIESFNP